MICWHTDSNFGDLPPPKVTPLPVVHESWENMHQEQLELSYINREIKAQGEVYGQKTLTFLLWYPLLHRKSVISCPLQYYSNHSFHPSTPIWTSRDVSCSGINQLLFERLEARQMSMKMLTSAQVSLHRLQTYFMHLMKCALAWETSTIINLLFFKVPQKCSLLQT